jgi:hypothetical protein
MDAALVAWGVFVRALGLCFSVALFSLRSHGQFIALSGARGISPLRELHAAYVGAYGTLGAAARFPSVFWVTGASDAALRVAPWVGIAASLGVVLGVLPPALGIGAAWAIFLSIDMGTSFTGAIFPWDTLLLEAGALGVWLPRVSPLWMSVRATSLPSPLLAFAVRWLLFRVLVGFGKLKFAGARWRDRGYIRGFLINMPIVNPVGFWVHEHLPRALFPVLLGGMFFVELILPWGLFFAGAPRFLSALGISGLMLGIQATGNFGHFNVLTATLALPSLLDAAPAPGAHWTAAPRAETAFLVLYALPASVLYFLANSWVNLGWIAWPNWERIPVVSQIFALLRLVAPLRLVGSYGVFGPTPAPPNRWVPVFEGSVDGQTWTRYEFAFYPSSARARPRFVAPHHPRLDHSLVYDAIGLNGHGPLGILNHGNAFGFSRTPTAARVALRLLEGASPEVRALFGNDPFPEAPPRYVRAVIYSMRPAQRSARKSGAVWRMDPVTVHLPPMGLDGPLWRPGARAESKTWAAEKWRAWIPRAPEELWCEHVYARRAWTVTPPACATAVDEARVWRLVASVRAWTVTAALDASHEEAALSMLEAAHVGPAAAQIGPKDSRVSQAGAAAAFAPGDATADERGADVVTLPEAARATLRLRPAAPAVARRAAALAVSKASLAAAVDVDASSLVFTWRHLPEVVRVARVAKNDEERAADSAALDRVCAPLVRAAERVWWRPAPSSVVLDAEADAYEADALRSGAGNAWADLQRAVVAAASPGDDWRARYRLLAASNTEVRARPGTPQFFRVAGVDFDAPVTDFGDNDDAPGDTGVGAMRNHLRFKLYAQWLLLMGGQSSLGANGAALRILRDDASALESSPLPLLFRALAPTPALSPNAAATEASSFLWGVHDYDSLAAAGEKAWIVAATSKPPSAVPAVSVGPGPAFAELMPRLAAHYMHGLFRPFNEHGHPTSVARVPVFRVDEDGDFFEEAAKGD